MQMLFLGTNLIVPSW